MYTDDEMLALSGIQHYRFCPRQWALIDIDQQWADNHLTIEGQLMHRHVDDPFYRQRCGDHITLRSVSVASRELGLAGVADAVELHPATGDEDTITHPRYAGRWVPVPVEYKHGRPKRDQSDDAQLAAQTMALEEQYGIHISHGVFFYGETRQRLEIDIDPELRSITRQAADDMHRLIASGRLPAAQRTPRCRSCSLKDICLPEIERAPRVSTYLQKQLYDEETP